MGYYCLVSWEENLLGRRRFLKTAGASITAASVLSQLPGCGSSEKDADIGPDGGVADGGPIAEGVAISVTRSEGVAPAGFMFSAEVEGFDVERPFHDLRYKWSFSDEGIYDRLAEDLPWGRDRNSAFGQVVAHAFTEPGSYTVTCEVTDGTKTEMGTTIVTITDANEVFAGEKTVCISPDENYSGAPSGAILSSSLDAVFSSLDPDLDLRILFSRGEDHTATIPFFTRFQKVHLGAFGQGSPPIVRSNVNFRECAGEIAVWGIDFVGGYDPTQPATTTRVGADLIFGSAVHTTISDCSMVGGDIPIRPGDEVLESLVVSNTDVRDWFNFGLLQGGGGWVGLCGVSMRQNPNTVRGSGKAEEAPPFYSDHGPFRLSRPSGPVCFNLVDLFTNSTWASAETTLQPTIRWNAGGVEQSQKLVLDRIRSEGGTLNLGVTSAGALPGAAEIIVDKFHHITTISPGSALSMQFGGTTLRNGIVVQADVAPESSTGLRTMLSVGADVEQEGNSDAPIEVYNCTIVDLRNPENATNGNGTAERDFSATGDRAVGEYYFANNLLYAPNARTKETSAMPLDLSSQWTPNYPGRRYLAEPFRPEFANSSETSSLFQVQVGSSAVAGSTGKAALDDFFGELRPETASLGATEPA